MSDASREQDDDFEARLASLPRDCIECDACGKAAPSVACERCATVYYCNASCRNKHKAEHSPDCHDIAAISQQQEAQVPTKEELLSAAGEDAINSECGICLEEQMQQPVVTLDCKHAFCSTCLVAWQRQKHNFTNPYMNPNQANTCPVCKTETEGNVEDDLLLRARLLASRAHYLKSVDPDAQRDLLAKALVILNQVLEVDVPHLQAYVAKAQVLNLLGEHRQVVDIIEETLAVNSERLEKVGILDEMDRKIQEAMMRGDMAEANRIEQQAIAYAEQEGQLGTRFGSEDATDLRLMQAEAYMELGEWETAKDIFMNKTPVLSNYGAGTPVQVRRSVMGLAQCAFEMKVYDKAIAASNWAIDINRSFPGVYKYKALAEKATGDLDAAIATMNRAVLYETPWDNDNRRKALALYDELLAEKQKQQAV